MPCYATTLWRIRCRRLPPSMIKSNCNGDNNISWYSTVLFDAKHNAARRTTATRRRRWQPQRCNKLHQSSFNANYNNNTKLLQQVYHMSTSTISNSDVKESTPKLISIHDHLNELHDIPLEDVRNFCIIAHVVRINNICCDILLHVYVVMCVCFVSVHLILVAINPII